MLSVLFASTEVAFDPICSHVHESYFDTQKMDLEACLLLPAILVSGEVRGLRFAAHARASQLLRGNRQCATSGLQFDTYIARRLPERP